MHLQSGMKMISSIIQRYKQINFEIDCLAMQIKENFGESAEEAFIELMEAFLDNNSVTLVGYPKFSVKQMLKFININYEEIGDKFICRLK